MTKTGRRKVLVLHGPNLNMLGSRESGIYGRVRLADIDASLEDLAKQLGIRLTIRQSNIEGELVASIQRCAEDGTEGILINPAAYGHTSIALRDALLAVSLPFIEIHISNTLAREEFRHKTYISDIASGIIIGLGPWGYTLGLRGLNQIIDSRHVAASDS